MLYNSYFSSFTKSNDFIYKFKDSIIFLLLSSYYYTIKLSYYYYISSI